MPEERKLVTVVFADIVGSAALGRDYDPEFVRELLRSAFAQWRAILEAHGGTVEKFIGDEVMAVFGVPQAHDNDAERAVRAAFALLAVRDPDPRIPLALRVGISTGEVVAGAAEPAQFLLTGQSVIEAARIRSGATPHEILVGSLTHRLTDRVVRYGQRRTIAAKGLTELEVWPAAGLTSPVPQRGYGLAGLRATLVGRDPELRQLLETFRRVAKGEVPELVTVFGSAGAGKSRLSEEFIAAIGNAPVRQGRCLPYGNGITLFPLQLILRADAGIEVSDEHAAAARKLRDAVRAALADSQEDEDPLVRRLEVVAGIAGADARYTK